MAERFERPEVDPSRDVPWPWREAEVRDLALSVGRTRRCSMCGKPIEALPLCAICGDHEDMAA